MLQLQQTANLAHAYPLWGLHLGCQPLWAVWQTGLASASQHFQHACAVSTLDCLSDRGLGAIIHKNN